MGRLLLVLRLALRDLRRRRGEAVLLLVAMLAATTTLTLGLVLRDAAGDPYRTTRDATAGPDVVAAAAPDRLAALTGAPGVAGHSGPFPVAGAKMGFAGRSSDVQVIGRDAAPAAVDRPVLTDGAWVRDGGVVLEAAFAGALDLGAGDEVTLNGRSFRVAGVAVSAATAPYPAATCLVHAGCASGVAPARLASLPPGLLVNPGVVWVTERDARGLGADLTYMMNVRLTDPAAAQAFIDDRIASGPADMMLTTWGEILAEATESARDAQILLLIGAWLLGLLAVAGLAVLVGGRMAEQTRRVGLLKAAGGTPGLVAAVLLAEYVLVAVVAAVAGLTVGSLTAPLFTSQAAGLIGGAGVPALTWGTAALVLAVALGVAVPATVVPAVRGARTSTVAALADAARPPRRSGTVIALSARLPVPLLLALRLAARRPRRAVLGAVSVAVTVSGLFVGLVLDSFLAGPSYGAGHAGPMRQVLLVIMGVLLALAAVNAIAITWATVQDNRHVSALSRALGASPRQVTAALVAAQALPALAGAVLGAFAGGFGLFHAIIAVTGGDSSSATMPAPWQLLALVAVTVAAVAALTALPARLGGRRPVTETLRAGLA